MSLFIDVHVLQSLPPSNVNRDDTGSPKSAVYGGVRRSRVSSQAWKRATRKRFADEMDASALGYRTKQAAQLIGERLAVIDPDMDETTRVERSGAVLKALGLDLEPKRKRGKQEDDEVSKYESSKYLVFFSSDQLDQLAELARSEGTISKRAAKEKADTNHGIAVSLFGRMVADDATLNVDATVQVAHALSTHAVDTEADYYTAVDDVSESTEEAGAGMIGAIEFNSSTLYRYATIDVDGLIKNMGDVATAAAAARTFVKSFITSMPTGKQNTFANGTLPDGVVVMVRDDQPVSLVGAFEVPVPAGEDGWVRSSCAKLATYADELMDAYGVGPRETWVTRVGARAASLEALGEVVNLEQLGVHIRETVLARQQVGNG